MAQLQMGWPGGKLLTLLNAILIGTALLFLASAAHAQKWYDIEVIIFSQLDSFGIETSPAKIQLDYPSNLIELNNDQFDNDFTIIDKSARRLNPDAYTLNSTGVYKVLYHQAWRQPGLPPGKAPWLRIRGGKRIGGHHELDGSIRLYLSSYLNFQTNLWLLKPGYNSSSSLPDNKQAAQFKYASTNDLPVAATVSPSNSESFSQGIQAGVGINRVYTLEQSERLLLDKVHYLDHSEMGVIVKVTRAKMAAMEVPPATPPQKVSPNDSR